MLVVDCRLIADLQPIPGKSKIVGGVTVYKNPMLHENISCVIRWYKGQTTFECRKIHADFGWQSGFYDHIIRNEESYQRIKNYIKNNPAVWKEEEFANLNL